MVANSKKFMNDPDAIVREMLEGFFGAHPDIVRPSSANPRAVYALDGPREGKVGLVIGGGSGHEPAFIGYVGKGLADAAVAGNVFASPAPEPILQAARDVHRGAGVLFMYGNYAGDVMNFDMAAEMAAMEDLTVRSVAVIDDVASAPRERRTERRGVAGDFFVFKAAGAASDKMLDLDGVVAAAEKANAATLTMGVAMSACTLPQSAAPNFHLGDGEMEIGMGVHGEPGISRGPVLPADKVADELVDRILAESGAGAGEQVSLLVNGLGSTTLMELYVLHRRVRQRLDDARISIHRSFVGEYVTSLEMAGASVSMIRLDDDLRRLLDHPCRTAALVVA
ncbi:dihydroxyacetone kinase subunit DhaK [Consotaella salsifontis]|uniref:Dihydroxyacetone kinase DhaK subunit n=1 Tax=Consotaella salsifontis TaxID=1365950 RepID=A0A1T4TED6_9HYPH|nr:dihydroxyacetone kinase subunit DhaK [Consotaella salsifontis]SKA38840.1 dihydroxyacetone kinase DhaK subunit [Consotaella salsifontis]